MQGRGGPGGQQNSIRTYRETYQTGEKNEISRNRVFALSFSYLRPKLGSGNLRIRTGGWAYEAGMNLTGSRTRITLETNWLHGMQPVCHQCSESRDPQRLALHSARNRAA